jgi:hypothetical protein
MTPIFLIGRARCGKTIVAEILQELGYYLPANPNALYDFEAIDNPECFSFFNALVTNDIVTMRKEFRRLSLLYPKLALKSHMLIYACKYLDVKIIVCHRKNKEEQANSMRVHVRDEPEPQLLKRLEEYDIEIEKLPDRLDWYLEDYWSDPKTEITKVCDFVTMSYSESLNKYNNKLVGK